LRACSSITSSAPATPAMHPASMNPESFTIVVGTAAASAARWLSRVAMRTRPERDFLTPADTRIARPRNARQVAYIT
jgi:hypothetical protein